jgi:predicted aspartyl protease
VELLRAVRCVEYLPTDPPMPGIRVEVREPLYGRSKAYTVPLDTGFAGYLMVPGSEYGELATMELAREGFGTYATLAGPITMRRARVLLRLFEEEFESIVETPLHGGGKLLLGRRLLNLLDLALLGKSAKACLAVEERAAKVKSRGPSG